MNTKKIVNIIIFAVAILVAVLSVSFVMVYNDDEVMYKQTSLIKENSPQMLDELKAATPEQLPQFVATYQEQANTLAAELKAQEMPNDILYTYIVNLKDLTEETLPAFQAEFPAYAARQFAKTDKKQAYMDGFAKVTDFASLQAYIHELEGEYNVARQDYLYKKDYVKAMNSMVAKAAVITESVTASKQETQLAELQAAISSSNKSETILNCAVTLCYVLFFTAIAMMICFALYQMVKNIKTAYKGVLAVLAMIVFFFIAYLIASPELSASAIKMGHTASQVKLIGAGVITFYAVLAIALLSVLCTWIMNLIKSR